MANRNYNLNTKYGRKKAREQAHYNYTNGTPEYRDEIDKIKGCVWAVIIVGMILFGILIYLTKGDAGLKIWLK
jgi:uncharacterized membrane protein YvbJ